MIGTEAQHASAAEELKPEEMELEVFDLAPIPLYKNDLEKKDGRSRWRSFASGSPRPMPS